MVNRTPAGLKKMNKNDEQKTKKNRDSIPDLRVQNASLVLSHVDRWRCLCGSHSLLIKYRINIVRIYSKEIPTTIIILHWQLHYILNKKATLKQIFTDVMFIYPWLGSELVGNAWVVQWSSVSDYCRHDGRAVMTALAVMTVLAVMTAAAVLAVITAAGHEGRSWRQRRR